jgi:hypothetical protein
MGMDVWTVDLLHVISISVGRASEQWQTGIRTVEFELRFLPYGWACPDGNPRRPDGCSYLPLFELGKKSEASRSRRVIQTDCWFVRTDTSWNRSFSIQKSVWTGIHVFRMDDALVWWASGRYDTSSRRLEHWIAGRPDGMTRRPDGWQGTAFSDLWSAQNLLEALLNSGIPVEKHLYI